MRHFVYKSYASSLLILDADDIEVEDMKDVLFDAMVFELRSNSKITRLE
jgi:hypothetical protein